MVSKSTAGRTNSELTANNFTGLISLRLVTHLQVVPLLRTTLIKALWLHSRLHPQFGWRPVQITAPQRTCSIHCYLKCRHKLRWQRATSWFDRLDL